MAKEEMSALEPSLEARLTRPAEIGIVPHDNDSMVDWYRQKLGLEVHSDTKIPIGYNRRHLCGEAIIKLLCVRRSPEARPPSPPVGPSLRRLLLAPNDDGAMYERASGLGSVISKRNGDGFEVVRVRDPDGNEIEIVKQVQAGQSPAVQVEVGASDVAAARDFYVAKLGLAEVEPDGFAPLDVAASISWREMRLNLVPATGKHPSPNGTTTDAAGIRYLTAIVADAGGTTDELTARGVHFPVKPMVWREVSLISFAADPNGNLIEIAGPLKPAKTSS